MKSEYNWINITKSGMRLLACFALFYEQFGFAAIYLGIAELLSLKFKN